MLVHLQLVEIILSQKRKTIKSCKNNHHPDENEDTLRNMKQTKKMISEADLEGGATEHEKMLSMHMLDRLGNIGLMEIFPASRTTGQKGYYTSKAAILPKP